MACMVCEHCNGVVKSSEKVSIRDGFSYHEKCHKCYVCSETNLQNAEVFKGVIFCSSCSKKIFQGCSTVRQRKKPREKINKSHRRRSHRTRDRHFRDGILELSALTAASSSSEKTTINNQSTGLTTDMTVDDKVGLSRPIVAVVVQSTGLCTDVTIPNKDEDSDVINKNEKKSNVEMGVTTDVTQQLLREMQCPVPDKSKPAPPVRRKKRNSNKKTESDLRIAELGVSTEIANMALRNKSEKPVIIKKSDFKKSMSMSALQAKSVTDDTEGNEEWMDSAYSSLRESVKTRWMDRRLRSIVKIPLESFKKHILTRSSLISDLTIEKDQETLLSKLKLLFNQEITEHQRRGLKRLYSTINRKKTPNRLGWLRLVTKTHVNEHNIVRSSSQAMRRSSKKMRSSGQVMKSSSHAVRSSSQAVRRSSHAVRSSSHVVRSSSHAVRHSSHAVRKNRHHQITCKHFKTSHSYRCMRSLVMRSAGPTASALACFRGKIRNMILPKNLLNITNINQKYLLNEACGPSEQKIE